MRMAVLSHFNIANVAAVITDPRQPDNPIVECNERFLHLTGYSRAEVIGRNCRFLAGPGTDRLSSDKLSLAIHHRRPEAVTILNYKKDGRPFVNSVTIFPIFEDGEVAYFFGLQIEVSDRGDGGGLERKAAVSYADLHETSAFFKD